MKKIVLAGGCFWGIQAYFNMVNGVTKTVAGYTNGDTKNPTYEEVCRGSGHAEALYIEYDETVTNLKVLLDHFFNIVDPTQKNRQGNDIGISYRSGIFCYDESDLDKVKYYVDSIRDQYQKPIVTELDMVDQFFKAEAYHQNYLDKNPHGYCHINLNAIRKIQK